MMKAYRCCWVATATFLTSVNGWISQSTPTPSRIPRRAANSAESDPLPAGGNLGTSNVSSRRDVLAIAAALTAGVVGSATCGVGTANALDLLEYTEKQQYALKFPTLFDPLYGKSYRKTIKRSIGRRSPSASSSNSTTTTGSSDDCTIWILEQNLELGPLQTPIRCTVIQLNDGTLWVHAPLAPTEEFFELVESCGSGGNEKAVVAHVVVPTYALEHKVFIKDALTRWPNAKLWTSPEQWSFPFAGISEDVVFGKPVSGVLLGSSYDSNNNFDSSQQRNLPPWSDEIEYSSLEAGTFTIGGKLTTLYETVFFHKASKSLIVTDAVAQIPKSVPPLNDPAQLLLISKRSTSDPMPDDTPQARLDGWEKTALLVSYFFPEHEEPDPNKAGVVTWTEGWHDNFNALAGRLIVPPVVRTLIYAQNPARVQKWVDQIADGRWDFDQIIPAHFEAPIAATPKDFATAFRFLQDSTIDEFPKNDMARGLKPIAAIALKIL